MSPNDYIKHSFDEAIKHLNEDEKVAINTWIKIKETRAVNNNEIILSILTMVGTATAILTIAALLGFNWWLAPECPGIESYQQKIESCEQEVESAKEDFKFSNLNWNSRGTDLFETLHLNDDSICWRRKFSSSIVCTIPN